MVQTYSGGTQCLVTDLDFGQSSLTGYVEYTGPVMQVEDLLQQLENAGCDVGVQHYFNQEAERSSQSVLPASNNPVLIDPIYKMCDLAATRDISVDDLVQALTQTKEEVELIQCMSIGQRNNPLWLVARQWRVTSSNFGKVCNRLSSQSYPPSLVK